MYSLDPYLVQRDMEMRVAGGQREAAVRRLARQATSAQQRRVRAWSRWLLCELGYLLVVLGARLEAYALPRSQPLEAESRRSS